MSLLLTEPSPLSCDYTIYIEGVPPIHQLYNWLGNSLNPFYEGWGEGSELVSSMLSVSCGSFREGISQPILLLPGAYVEDGSRGGILPCLSHYRMG